MPRFAYILAAAILSGSPAALLAQDKPVGLTLEQYQQAGRSRLSDRDADGDGKISKAEFSAAAPARKPSGGDAASAPAAGGGRMAEMVFARFDKDGDGALSKDEIDAMLAARFKRLDTNGDGILTEQERQAGRMARRGGMSQDQ